MPKTVDSVPLGPSESPHRAVSSRHGKSENICTKLHPSVVENHSWESSVLNGPHIDQEEGPGRRLDRELKAFTLQENRSRQSWPQLQSKGTWEGHRLNRFHGVLLLPVIPNSSSHSTNIVHWLASRNRTRQ